MRVSDLLLTDFIKAELTTAPTTFLNMGYVQQGTILDHLFQTDVRVATRSPQTPLITHGIPLRDMEHLVANKVTSEDSETTSSRWTAQLTAAQER